MKKSRKHLEKHPHVVPWSAMAACPDHLGLSHAAGAAGWRRSQIDVRPSHDYAAALRRGSGGELVFSVDALDLSISACREIVAMKLDISAWALGE